MDLLPLPHGEGTACQLELLGECLYVTVGVCSHREEADKGCGLVTLLPHLLEVQDHTLSILLSCCFCNVLPGLSEGAVWAQASMDGGGSAVLSGHLIGCVT